MKYINQMNKTKRNKIVIGIVALVKSGIESLKIKDIYCRESNYFKRCFIRCNPVKNLAPDLTEYF